MLPDKYQLYSNGKDLMVSQDLQIRHPHPGRRYKHQSFQVLHSASFATLVGLIVSLTVKILAHSMLPGKVWMAFNIVGFSNILMDESSAVLKRVVFS